MQSVAGLTQEPEPGFDIWSDHILSFLLLLIQEGQLTVTGKRYVHEVLDSRLGGLSLPRKSVVRLTHRPDMTIDVYLGRKTTQEATFLGFQGDLVPIGTNCSE